MARIILKSRYLRAGSKQHSEHLIQYIAKREGVQKIDDAWKHQPATKEQRKLIGELLTLDNPYHCPHGRPTIIAMTKRDLEKKFKRIV